MQAKSEERKVYTNPWQAPALMVACMVGLAIIIAAWPVLPTIAPAVLITSLLFGLAVGCLWLYGYWLKITERVLEHDEQGNVPVLIERRKMQGYHSPAGNTRNEVPYHYAPSVHYGSKGYQESPTAVLEPPATALPAPELPEKIDLLTRLNQLQLDRPNMEIYFGESEKGAIIKPFGPDTLHIGNVGATGSGKSAQSQSILFQLAALDPEARRVKLAFVDFEGKTSQPFHRAPHLAFVASDPEEAHDALTGLENEMKRRATLPEAALMQLPVFAVMLEEFLSLKDELPPSDWQRLITLAIRGRKSRIYLILASQALYSSEDTRILRGQIRTRNAFAFEDDGTARAFGITDTRALAALRSNPLPGRFLQRTPGGLLLAQAPYISPDTISKYFEKWHYYNASQEHSKGATSPAGGRETAQSWQSQPETVINTSYKVMETRKVEDDFSHLPKRGTRLYDALVAYAPGISVQGLADKLDCSKSTAQGYLEELRQRGLIEPLPPRKPKS